jgi:hypothetical protein
MRRRIGREDFKGASPSSELKDSGYFEWAVFEEFDLMEGERFPYFRASLDKGGRNYRPLVDTPYLFLEFARLAEHKGHPDTALETWISKYGLLGLSDQKPALSLALPPEEDWTTFADRYPEVTVPSMNYRWAGGPGDTHGAYLLEIAKSNKLITLYEAILNQDSEKIVQCYAFHEGCDPEELREKWRSELEENREIDLKLKGKGYGAYRGVLDDGVIYEALPTDWTSFLIDMALRDIWKIVGAALSVFAYPSITAQGMLGPLSPGKLRSHWGARNLLGAMYLQFYWLITSAGDLSRCKYCERIISYAPAIPESEGRKPRKDKEFCDSRCRQNYHYHNRIKPTRKAT